MQRRSEPSFFFTKRTGAAWEEAVGRMKLVFRFLSMKVRRAESSTGDSEYRVPKGGEVSSSSSIFKS